VLRALANAPVRLSVVPVAPGGKGKDLGVGGMSAPGVLVDALPLCLGRDREWRGRWASEAAAAVADDDAPALADGSVAAPWPSDVRPEGKLPWAGKGVVLSGVRLGVFAVAPAPAEPDAAADAAPVYNGATGASSGAEIADDDTPEGLVPAWLVTPEEGAGTLVLTATCLGAGPVPRAAAEAAAALAASPAGVAAAAAAATVPGAPAGGGVRLRAALRLPTGPGGRHVTVLLESAPLTEGDPRPGIPPGRAGPVAALRAAELGEGGAPGSGRRPSSAGGKGGRPGSGRGTPGKSDSKLGKGGGGGAKGAEAAAAAEDAIARAADRYQWSPVLSAGEGTASLAFPQGGFAFAPFVPLGQQRCLLTAAEASYLAANLGDGSLAAVEATRICGSMPDATTGDLWASDARHQTDAARRAAEAGAPQPVADSAADRWRAAGAVDIGALAEPGRATCVVEVPLGAAMSGPGVAGALGVLLSVDSSDPMQARSPAGKFGLLPPALGPIPPPAEGKDVVSIGDETPLRACPLVDAGVTLRLRLSLSSALVPPWSNPLNEGAAVSGASDLDVAVPRLAANRAEAEQKRRVAREGGGALELFRAECRRVAADVARRYRALAAAHAPGDTAGVGAEAIGEAWEARQRSLRFDLNRSGAFLAAREALKIRAEAVVRERFAPPGAAADALGPFAGTAPETLGEAHRVLFASLSAEVHGALGDLWRPAPAGDQSAGAAGRTPTVDDLSDADAETARTAALALSCEDADDPDERARGIWEGRAAGGRAGAAGWVDLGRHLGRAALPREACAALEEALGWPEGGADDGGSPGGALRALAGQLVAVAYLERDPLALGRAAAAAREGVAEADRAGGATRTIDGGDDNDGAGATGAAGTDAIDAGSGKPDDLRARSRAWALLAGCRSAAASAPDVPGHRAAERAIAAAEAVGAALCARRLAARAGGTALSPVFTNKGAGDAPAAFDPFVAAAEEALASGGGHVAAHALGAGGLEAFAADLGAWAPRTAGDTGGDRANDLEVSGDDGAAVDNDGAGAGAREDEDLAGGGACLVDAVVDADGADAAAPVASVDAPDAPDTPDVGNSAFGLSADAAGDAGVAPLGPAGGAVDDGAPGGPPALGSLHAAAARRLPASRLAAALIAGQAALARGRLAAPTTLGAPPAAAEALAAARAASALGASSETDARPSLVKARAYASAGRLERAAAQLLAAANRAPGSLRAGDWLLLARAAESAAGPAAAVRVLRRATVSAAVVGRVAGGPADDSDGPGPASAAAAAAWAALASAHARLGEWPAADAAAGEAVARDAAAPAGWAWLAACRLALAPAAEGSGGGAASAMGATDAEDAARSMLKVALRHGLRDPAPLVVVADLWGARGRPDEAAAVLRLALSALGEADDVPDGDVADVNADADALARISGVWSSLAAFERDAGDGAAATRCWERATLCAKKAVAVAGAAAGWGDVDAAAAECSEGPEVETTGPLERARVALERASARS